ncbi:MAG: hypothetical protein JWO81_3114 [Alphaproteobacteria bacterium]|nr:hypothetical protein [Alphaproteobacteria bacterium]
MKWPVKLLVGLVAVLLLGWVWHGPAGRGEAFAAALDAQARDAIAPIDIPGIKVRMARDPVRRVAIMSGPANDIQREGLGSGMGLSDYVRSVPGVAGVHWSDAPGGAGGLPMLAETWILLILAYALGLGLGALLFGRPRRRSFLD